MGGLNNFGQLTTRSIPDETTEQVMIKDCAETTLPACESESYGSRGALETNDFIENNSHGGSWVDSFEVDSGIDKDLSDNYV